MRIGIVGASLSGIIVALRIKEKHPDYDVVLFEQNEKIAKKIYATGNGHCNLLHVDSEPISYSCPDFVAPFLKKYPYSKLVDYYSSLGIPLIQIGDLVYPKTYSAPAFVAFLEHLLADAGVEIRLNSKVLGYVCGSSIAVKTERGNYKFDALYFACGGKSGKNLGSDGNFVSEWRRHGYGVAALKPALCPIQIEENVKILSGLRHEAKITIEAKDNKFEESGEILFKKDGLSGIVIFNASLFLAKNDIRPGQIINVDLFPNETSVDLESSLWTNSFRDFYLDAYLQKPLITYLHLSSSLSPTEIARKVKNLSFTYQGNYSFEDSQVTLGGIELTEVDASLMSKREKNVFFVGECLDVAGYCGGYNLGWALISALASTEW